MSVELRLALQEERSADLAERVRRLLGPFSGNEAALDAGCGTGALALALAPHVSEVVGMDTAKLLTMTGDTITGERAQEIGLVTEVAHDPMAAAEASGSSIMTQWP